MIKVDRKKFTSGEIQFCERDALYTVMGYLSSLSERPEGYTREVLKVDGKIVTRLRKIS